jgi:hypothetical protein
MRNQTSKHLIRRAIVLALILLFALSVLNAPAVAKPAATYTVDWWTIDSGCATALTGGVYELSGTVGQADAGALSGGTYTLGGGFWGGAADLLRLFLPLILR